MAFEHRRRPDADLIDHAGAQVLDQDVGALAQPVQLLDILGLLQVERDGTLVAVLAVEIQRSDAILREGRPPAARIVAAIGLFHLDHIGAHIGHDRPRERAGQRLAHLDDADTFQRQVHRRFTPSSLPVRA
jgi:hypothetical protein